ncbi:MAG: hypothetical protein ACYC9Q_02435 [Bacillota bacterium]
MLRNKSRRSRHHGAEAAHAETVCDLLFVRPAARSPLLVILNAPSTQVGAALKERERAGWSLAAIGHIRVVGERVKVVDGTNWTPAQFGPGAKE